MQWKLVNKLYSLKILFICPSFFFSFLSLSVSFSFFFFFLSTSDFVDYAVKKHFMIIFIAVIPPLKHDRSVLDQQ